MAGVAMMALPSLASAQAEQAPAAASEAAQADDFGEIVVTAQRRSELARDVPISITALSGQQLQAAGIADTVSLSNITPGLRMDRIGNFTIPAIRGVTSTITGPGADNNVAIYLDGVYQAEATVNNFDLPDVDQVAVLKGPQGTLFGRNATGGAIQIFTKKPGNELEGNISVSYGSYHDLQVKGFVSSPLIEDKVAFSVATSYRKSQSYYTDITRKGARDISKSSVHPDGIDSKLVRAKLLLTPTDKLEVLLSVLYSDHMDTSAVLGSALNGNSLSRVLDPNAIIPKNPYETASESQPFQRSKVTTYAGKIDWEVGPGTLSSVTSYSKFLNFSLLDSDYAATTNGVLFNFEANSTNRSFTEEITYATKMDGPLNVSLGAFYIDGWAGWTRLGLRTPSPANDIDIWGRQEITSYAGFGEVYYDITDRVKVIVGGRYSHEKRSLIRAFALPNADPNVPVTGCFVCSYFPAGERSWNSFTPRASIKFDLNSRSNVYFSYSKGFKSGVFDATSPAAVPAVNPETLDAFEIGFKGRVAPWLSLNAAGYYYDYKDIQIVFFEDDPITRFPRAALGNAGGAKIKGFEMDANFNFGRHFDGRIGLNYLDTKYNGFGAASVAVPNGQTYCVSGCGAGQVPVQGRTLLGTPDRTGTHTEGYDANGNSLIKAPKFTIYATANYHADVAGGTLDLSGTIYHSSTMYFTFDHRVNQAAWENVDARIAWTPENDKFTFSVFGKNLTDKAVVAGTFIQAGADGISYAPPRTFGVQLDVRF